MARRARLQPYQQGELDGLCGIYAIINAFRLVLWRHQAAELAEEDWMELFHVVLAGADERVGAVRVAAAGIEPKPLKRLLKLAARHMSDQHDIALTVSRPLKPIRRGRLRSAVERLSANLQAHDSALLVCFMGHHNHWSVVRKIGTATLELFDSDGLSRVCLANCRLKYERRRSGREHVIEPRTVFQITLSIGGS